MPNCPPDAHSKDRVVYLIDGFEHYIALSLSTSKTLEKQLCFQFFPSNFG